ncbi:MAG: hypothetical protein ACYCQI_04840 [Gammaproteobacteria bacterium]
MKNIHLIITVLSVIALFGVNTVKADHRNQEAGRTAPTAPRTVAIQHAPHPIIQQQQRAAHRASHSFQNPQPQTNQYNHEEHHHDRDRTTVFFYPYLPAFGEPFVPDTYYDDSSTDNSSYNEPSNDNTGSDNSSYSSPDNSTDSSDLNGNWVSAQNGAVPDNAISYQENNVTVYYCRALYNNQIYYGRLTDACYVEDKANAATIRLNVYDVLVQ